MSMTPEEFERLKEAEKVHLRKLRALKQQHRHAQRKKGLLDALKGIVRPDLDDVHDEMLDKLTMKNIESEARFEIALENASLTDDALESAAREEAEREVLQKAQAEALVRRMKAEAGAGVAPASSQTNAEAGGKTIGRAPTPEEPETESDETPSPTKASKTIGRS
jgi:hypothetical protein